MLKATVVKVNVARESGYLIVSYADLFSRLKKAIDFSGPAFPIKPLE